MNDRPTPETDAVWADKSKNILEHARRLERERDELLAALEEALAYPVCGNWHERAEAAISKAKGGAK